MTIKEVSNLAKDEIEDLVNQEFMGHPALCTKMQDTIDFWNNPILGIRNQGLGAVIIKEKMIKKSPIADITFVPGKQFGGSCLNSSKGCDIHNKGFCFSGKYINNYGIIAKCFRTQIKSKCSDFINLLVDELDYLIKSKKSPIFALRIPSIGEIPSLKVAEDFLELAVARPKLFYTIHSRNCIKFESIYRQIQELSNCMVIQSLDDEQTEKVDYCGHFRASNTVGRLQGEIECFIPKIKCTDCMKCYTEENKFTNKYSKIR